ncbi:SURF1 family cytochrome oxidase biogenesis protein [Actinacidiphila yeochonensis]|uniref:SURF1 family cytochrome oxidase biogenesis protein n=1 Tax=Actinacidiphila yeochonensis TaxID=89050 RepID=UPI00055F8CF0|nr:SURF1 family protein [Actinacidiphila yeochonensis]
MLRVLLTRRWIILTVVFVALVLVMYRLGLWQFHRYQQTKRQDHRISRAVHTAPVAIGTLTAPGAKVPESERYRPVTVTGRYDTAHQFVVRRRTDSDGNLGYFLVTPLVTADHQAVLVNRGWVAPSQTDDAAFPPVPSTPSGAVTLTGRLMPDETSKLSGIRDVSGLPPRQYMLINSAEQAKVLAEPVLGGYLELVSSRPPLTKADSAELVPGPDSDSQTGSDEAIVGKGVHLPYAVQWWLFALMVPAGWVVLLRQDLKERRKKAAAQARARAEGEAAAAEPATPRG